MRLMDLAVMLALAAVPAALAQTPPPQKTAPVSTAVKCRTPGGTPCTYRQVKALSDAVFAGKSKHDVLLPVKDVALASPDGTLRCAQSDGSICTTPELDVIKEIAFEMQLYINYNGAKSGGK